MTPGRDREVERRLSELEDDAPDDVEQKMVENVIAALREARRVNHGDGDPDWEPPHDLPAEAYSEWPALEEACQ